jgi:hypothetical protein
MRRLIRQSLSRLPLERRLRKRPPARFTNAAAVTARGEEAAGSSGDPSADFLAGLANEFVAVATTAQKKGRAAISRCDIPAGTTVWECLPLAKVVKPPAPGLRMVEVCAHCFRPLSATSGRQEQQQHDQYCCERCRAAAWSHGEEILSRCDLGPLEQLHRATGRRFPLLAARLVGRMLCEFKNSRGTSPTAANVAHLCFARFAPQIRDELRADHALIRAAFVGSCIVRPADFDHLFPPEWYFRAVGSLQLNAFELVVNLGTTAATAADGDDDAAATATATATGTGAGTTHASSAAASIARELRASALLPGVASFFNHSCDPSLLVATDHSAVTRFVTARPILRGEELCISYIGGGGGSGGGGSGDSLPSPAAASPVQSSPASVVSLDSPCATRRAFLVDKYGFTCSCALPGPHELGIIINK